MQPETKLVSAEQLLKDAALYEGFRFDAKVAAAPQNQAALTEGFHLYVDIGLTLAISAAEDDTSALTYLRILEEFAAIADRAADISDARLLEVQGERLHFLVECPRGSKDGVRRLLTLAYSVVNVAYDRLAKLAGEHWKGCKAAADHGRAVLLVSDTGGGSAVSLGVAANRPAKRLGQTGGVRAGHLAVPAELAPPEFAMESEQGWKQIDLLKGSEALLRHVEQEKRAHLASIRFDAEPRGKIGMGDKSFFDSFAGSGQIAPVKVQGFCLRADLDGFSKQVEDAFANGTQAVLALVDRFRRLLSLPKEFEGRVRARVLAFPWAGDCATVVLLPQAGESFSAAVKSLPASSALTWHKLPEEDRRFGEYMGGAKWAVGVAAGAAEEGNEGRMLVAQLRAQGRTFRVVAGWAARRSSDGYQLDGIRGGETVVTEQDHRALASVWQKSFSRVASAAFFKAPLTVLSDARQSAVSATAQPKPTSSPVGITIPSPRPHAEWPR